MPADGLAVAGNAPKVFLRTSRTGLPYVAVTTCGAFALLSYMAVSTSSGMVFIWFSNMTANAGLMSWFCISVIYLRFRKGFFAQGYTTADLPYSSPLQPYAAWWAVVSSFAMLFVRFSCSASAKLNNFLGLMGNSSADGKSS